MSLLSAELFVPHPYAHIVGARVFPQGAVPEAAYQKFIREYEGLDGVCVSRIVYESDGLRVTGIRVLPGSVTPGAHPVLLFNRGGNGEYGKLTVLNVLRHMAPFARAGFLVFASNYRGNDGGEGRDEFGGSDLNDVLNLLSLARAHEGFDGRNAYMLGHSRGGMMTYMALRGRARVNAAISLAGISDVRLQAREKPSMRTHVFERLFPEGDMERELEKRSALAWPGEIDTPLLLLHGDADEAAHVNHSIALDAALKERGKEVSLHIYPRGNHALYRVWDDVVARSLHWMEAHKA